MSSISLMIIIIRCWREILFQVQAKSTRNTSTQDYTLNTQTQKNLWYRFCAFTLDITIVSYTSYNRSRYVYLSKLTIGWIVSKNFRCKF